MPLEEPRYMELAHVALGALEDLFEQVDAEQVDVERAGDVVTLTFSNRKRCVVNTQRPTRQIWLAANARAWHFDWDEATRTWLDTSHRSLGGGADAPELFATVRAVVKEQSGVDLP